MINNQSNNILSYFIKDIKDDKRPFYIQVNNKDNISIFYKNDLLYYIGLSIRNYINNIIKSKSFKFISTHKICSNSNNNFKFLYYKNDKKINFGNKNYIEIYFTYNKYLNKQIFNYFVNNNYLLLISIIYYTRYKFIKINKGYSKFASTHILIPNKYELHYYCKLYMIIYFVNN
jgi:hypothetical protein